MAPEEIINEISEWANASHAYLSNREGYPQGYRNGISQAKVIILDILSKAHHTSEEEKLFPIIGITKQELEDNRFDTSNLDESDMLTMADKIKDALNDNGYQDILNIVAEECMDKAIDLVGNYQVYGEKAGVSGYWIHVIKEEIALRIENLLNDRAQSHIFKR